jgi:gas vesicle protein
MMNNKSSNENRRCAGRFIGFVGTRLMFLAVGGGIGAAIALLFAPKSGNELRTDISEAARNGFEDVAHKAKRVQEHYETARKRGSFVMNAAKYNAVTIKNEISSDAAKIGAMLEDARKDVVAAVKVN